MNTAGKAVLLSGATVLISLSAVMLLPSPSFRSMAGGIMLSVAFVLAATLTLLPLVLVKLDKRINALALPWARVGEHRSPVFERWGQRLWKRPFAWGAAALAILIALSIPLAGLKTAMPSIAVLPSDANARVSYDQVKQAFGPGAPGTLQIITPSSTAAQAHQILATDPGIAGAMPPTATADASGLSLISAVPKVDPSDPTLTATVDRLRAELPDGTLVGGAAAENLDLKTQLDTSTPIVITVILLLGFALLLVALRAPLIALIGTGVSLLSTAAAFGVARLVFQDGIGASLLGFECRASSTPGHRSSSSR